jgi:DNA-binding transcriptional LysR family regulator
VSGAAEVLHLTQPAVSQHIAALESALGIALFQRMPRRMLPTEAGKRLYSRVVNAIETLESIPTKTALADALPLIRLGAPADFFNDYIVQRLRIRQDVLLKVQFGLAQELIESLVENQIDGAIATQKITRPELDYQPVLEENFWLVGPPALLMSVSPDLQESQDFAQMDLRTLEQWLRKQAWIAYSEDLPIIRRFWRVTFGQRLDVNPQFVMPDLRSIRAAIAHGWGYSVLPDYLCQDWITSNRLTLILKPPQSVTNQIWFAYRKKERQSQVITLLFDWLGA